MGDMGETLGRKYVGRMHKRSGGSLEIPDIRLRGWLRSANANCDSEWSSAGQGEDVLVHAIVHVLSPHRHGGVQSLGGVHPIHLHPVAVEEGPVVADCPPSVAMALERLGNRVESLLHSVEHRDGQVSANAAVEIRPHLLHLVLVVQANLPKGGVLVQRADEREDRLEEHPLQHDATPLVVANGFAVNVVAGQALRHRAGPLAADARDGRQLVVPLLIQPQVHDVVDGLSTHRMELKVAERLSVSLAAQAIALEQRLHHARLQKHQVRALRLRTVQDQLLQIHRRHTGVDGEIRQAIHTCWQLLDTADHHVLAEAKARQALCETAVRTRDKHRRLIFGDLLFDAVQVVLVVLHGLRIRPHGSKRHLSGKKSTVVGNNAQLRRYSAVESAHGDAKDTQLENGQRSHDDPQSYLETARVLSNAALQDGRSGEPETASKASQKWAPHPTSKGGLLVWAPRRPEAREDQIKKVLSISIQYKIKPMENLVTDGFKRVTPLDWFLILPVWCPEEWSFKNLR
eukprot:scaffold2171_cov253-Pinguiococcus_pyrenoidosus.AAC.6